MVERSGKLQLPDDASEKYQEILRRHFPSSNLNNWPLSDVEGHVAFLRHNLSAWSLRTKGVLAEHKENNRQLLTALKELRKVDFDRVSLDWHDGNMEAAFEAWKLVKYVGKIADKENRFGGTKLDKQLRKGIKTLTVANSLNVLSGVNARNLTAIEFARIVWKRHTGISAPKNYRDTGPFFKFAHDFFEFLNLGGSSVENANKNWLKYRYEALKPKTQTPSDATDS